MILRSVKLNNIRTYEDELVGFSEGSTLLSGDIGSGKSSVLLCIEFGLFGLQRGEISGTDLLRHGANEGFVELCFDDNGTKITLGRYLKRTKKGITQESGFIDIDGTRSEKSPSDLRALVLELLGYPQEYVNKNPIMFRYTVYTPQDEMKKILFADAEERLRIIRKIFDIDKYGRIRDNASDIILKEFRALKRECQVKFSDLEQKIKEKKEKEDRILKINDELDVNRKEVYNCQQSLDSVEREYEMVSERISILNNDMQELTKNNTLISQKRLRLISVNNEIRTLQTSSNQLKTFLDAIIENPNLDEKILAERQRQLDVEKSKLNSNIGFLDSELRRLQTVLTKGMCEFCSQSVSNISDFKGKVDDKQKQLMDSKNRINEIFLETKDIERQKQLVVKYNTDMLIRKEKQKQYEDYTKKLEYIGNEKTLLEIDILSIEEKVKQLNQTLSSISELQNIQRNLKKDIDKWRYERDKWSKNVAVLEQEIKYRLGEIENILTQIDDKEKSKIRFDKLSEVITWLETIFIPLTETIEKHVLSTIQSEFNQFFQQWFEVLIPNQSISVGVDDSFTPIIEQGGYQTEYQNLSGGEKTSVALAYRLALNKVINSMVEGIKTKDLIILDEPTDGFSTDQFDRLRDVINDLGLKQMLIVSHEPKIDTYVDNVIRFYKEGNVSRVVR